MYASSEGPFAMVRKEETGDQSIPSRRQALKLIGGSAFAGLAGCMNQGGTGDGTPTETLAPPDPEADEWPDLTGREVHILTDETDTRSKEFHERLSQEFFEKTNGNITWEYAGAGGGGLDQRAVRLVQSGNPPELVFSSKTPAGTRLYSDALRPVTTPLENIMGRMGSVEERARLQQDGEDWIVPIWANAVSNWYRDDVVDMGITTWDDQLEWVQAAEENITESDFYPYYMPAAQHWCAEGVIATFGWSNGATIAGRDGDQVTVNMADGSNRDRWIEMLEHFEQLYQYSPDTRDSTCSAITVATSSGLTASQPLWGFRSKVRSILNEREWADTLRAGQPPENRERVSYGAWKGFVSFKGSDGGAADTFIEFFMRENYLEEQYLVTPLHNIPVWDHMQDYISWEDQLSDAWTSEDIQTCLEIPSYMISGYDEVENGNPFAGAMLGEMQLSQMTANYLTSDRSPGDVVDETASELQDILENTRGD